MAEENIATDSLLLSSGEETSKNTTDDSNSSECNAGRSTTKRKSSSQIDSVAKRSRNNADEEIDANRCCVCFGLYSDDAGTAKEWLMCSCTRWIHEDCIDNDDINIDNGVFCPLC